MPDFDPYSALLADEPTALEMAKARAAALRGQNYAGMVMGLAHDPQAAKMGGELMQQAQTGQTQLGEMPGQRMQRMLHQQALEKGQREAAPYTDPAQAALFSQGQQQAAERFGGSIPAGASPATGQLLLQALEKAATIPKFVPAGYGTTGTIDTRTGGYVPFPEGANGAIDPAVVKQQADIYKKTGVLPNMGKLNPQYHAAILKEVASGGESGADIVATRAGNTGDTAALKKLQVQADSMDSFEKTALANLRMFKEQAGGIVDVGSPLFNAPARKFMQAVAGDPKMTAFNVSRQVAVQEISKVLGGGLGSAAVSDSARHEVEGLIGPDASLAQIFKAADILEADMANRKTATHAQLAEIHGRIAGKKSDTTTTPPPAAKKKVYDPATGTIKDAP